MKLRFLGWAVVSKNTGYVIEGTHRSKKMALKFMCFWAKQCPDVSFDLKRIFVEE